MSGTRGPSDTSGTKDENLDRFIFIPNGVDLSPEEKNSPWKEHTPEGGERIILSVGRLGPEKRTEALTKALLPLLESFGDTSLMLVGDGPSRKSIMEIARKAGLEHRILLPGFLPFSQVQQLYRRATFFVSAALSENHPLTFMEAAAAGLPLILRDAGDSRGILLDGENGFLADSDSRIRDAAVRLLTDPGLTETYALRSREIARCFDMNTTVEKVLNSYKAAIALYSPPEKGVLSMRSR